MRLIQDEGVIEGQQNLKEYITNFYKGVFGQPDISGIRLVGEDFEKIDTEDVEMLVRPFDIKELELAVFGMATNKAPGPDGFNADFYQKNWGLVKVTFLGYLLTFMLGL